MAKEAQVILKIKVDVNDAEKGMNALTKQTSSLDKALGLVAGAKAFKGIVDFGADAYKSFATFEDSMLRVKAVTGATTKEYEIMYNMAIKASEETRYSSTEAANAMYFMGQAGWSAQESMDALQGTLALASAEGMGLEQATRIVTESVVAFNLEAKDSGHIADVLAQASISSNVSVEELGISLEGAAAAANVFGFSLEDTISALAIMAQHGVRSSRAATSLRSGMLRLGSPTEKAAAEMKKIGLNVFDAQGNMRGLLPIIRDLQKALGGLTDKQKTEAINKIFGKQAVTGWMALINTSTKELNKMSKEIENSEGQAKNMQDTMNSGAGGAMARFKNAVENIKTAFGKDFAKTLNPVIDSLTDFLNALRPVVPYIAPIVGAVGGLVAVLLALGVAVKGVNLVLPVLAAGVGLLANPWTWVVLGIMAAVWAISTFISKYEEFKVMGETFQKFMDSKKDELINTFGQMGDVIWKAFKKPFDDAKLAFDNVLKFFKTKIDNFAKLMNVVIEAVIGNFSSMWDDAVRGIKDIINSWVIHPLNASIIFINALPLPFKLNKIPLLAKGAVAKGPMPAIFGEAGPEIALPLTANNISRFMEAASSKGYAPSGNNNNIRNGSQYNLTINANKVDGPSIERYIDFMSRRDGW